MATLFGAYPFLRKLHAGRGHAGPQFQAGLARVMRQVWIEVRIELRPKAGRTEIVKRSDAATGCTVLPKRWIVERTRGAVRATPG